jgi:hypothetical protein
MKEIKSNLIPVLLLVAVVSVMLSSCNKSADNLTPSNNKNVLGLVVQTASQNSPNVILLKDGREISPVSGFTPSKVMVGNKFVLSFEAVSSTSSLINVKVTSFQIANDSAFTVPVPAKAVSLPGTYTGTFNYFNVQDSSLHTSGATSLTLTSDTYTAGASTVQGGCLGGAGKYSASSDKITFTDATTWPSGTDMNRVLTGTFGYSATSSSLLLWKLSDDRKTSITYVFAR